MNDKIILLNILKYIKDKNSELGETEYLKLDKLAELLLNADDNFDEIETTYGIILCTLNSYGLISQIKTITKNELILAHFL